MGKETDGATERSYALGIAAEGKLVALRRVEPNTVLAWLREMDMLRQALTA